MIQVQTLSMNPISNQRNGQWFGAILLGLFSMWCVLPLCVLSGLR